LTGAKRKKVLGLSESFPKVKKLQTNGLRTGGEGNKFRSARTAKARGVLWGEGGSIYFQDWGEGETQPDQKQGGGE